MNKAEAKIVKRGSKWCVVSEDGKRNFGCYTSKHDAHVRLGQIEIFKKKSKGGLMPKIIITSDGTSKGTTVTVGDKTVVAPTGINFFISRYGENDWVDFSYAITEDVGNGMSEERRFFLQKDKKGDLSVAEMSKKDVQEASRNEKRRMWQNLNKPD